VQTTFPNWNNNFPVTFDNTGVPGNLTQNWFVTNYGILRTINNGNRIQYSPNIVRNAEEWGFGTGAQIRVYGACVGPRIWATNQTREDMIASANHEAVHCRQDAAARDNIPANNVWRLLDAQLGGVTSPGYVAFAEAEAHLSELRDTNVGWYHAISRTQRDLANFYHRFRIARDRWLPRLTGATRNAARALLQNIYQNIPFEEMKRDGYDYHVRPPQ
jgi:hypothetical protein